MLRENGGGVTVIRFALSTVKRRAGTPPKVTVVAPAKPEPRTVAVPGAYSNPPNGITAVMLGTTLVAVVSTYSKVELGPGALDSPPATVTSRQPVRRRPGAPVRPAAASAAPEAASR